MDCRWMDWREVVYVIVPRTSMEISRFQGTEAREGIRVCGNQETQSLGLALLSSIYTCTVPKKKRIGRY